MRHHRGTGIWLWLSVNEDADRLSIELLSNVVDEVVSQAATLGRMMPSWNLVSLSDFAEVLCGVESSPVV